MKVKLALNWKAGLAVSLISLPLSISLAVASGVSPIAGIITAIWAGFTGAILAGSNYNIIGPTGALSGIIASFALTQGPSNVPSLAVIAGALILLGYFCHLERFLIFIPSSVIHGFTLGVACIIGLNQINAALGLGNVPQHERFMQNVVESLRHVGQGSLWVFFVFIVFFIVLMLLSKVLPRIPGAIMVTPFALMLGYASEKAQMPFFLETLGMRFGDIKPVLTQWPSLSLSSSFIIPAFVVAFVAIIETMLSAKIADTVTKTKHDPRREILGLGFANIASGLAGGIPATAALARTSLNIRAGATSNISALLNSIFMVAGSFIFFPYFRFMPMAVIAAILVFVAVRMVEREHFIRLLYHDKPHFLIALIVASLTVYFDPIIGIVLGAALALLFLVNSLAKSYYELIVHESKAAHRENLIDAEKRNLLIYAFKGKLVYLNSKAHLMRFQSDFSSYAGIILVLHDVYFIDLDGVDTLDEIIELIQKESN